MVQSLQTSLHTLYQGCVHCLYPCAQLVPEHAWLPSTDGWTVMMLCTRFDRERTSRNPHVHKLFTWNSWAKVSNARREIKPFSRTLCTRKAFFPYTLYRCIAIDLAVSPP